MNTFKTQVNSGDGMDISDKEDLHACSSYHLYITISKTAPINEENCVSERKLTTLPWFPSRSLTLFPTHETLPSVNDHIAG